MKKALFIILLFTGFIANAQNTAILTLTASKPGPATATLILEDVHFHPNLGTGLADTRLETAASVNFNKKTSEKAVVKLNEPKIMRLQYSGNGVNKTWMLFVQPGDELNINFSDNADVSFSGKNAAYQDFLKSYFLENQFQYLPVFGYKPSQINNESVVQQSDSLKQVRLNAFQKFKSSNTVVPAFEAYVMATTHTEPSLMRRLIQEKIMRRNRVVKLDAAQRKELEDFTLTDFKIQPDDALLSQAYRDELRNWVLIPSTRRFPLESGSRYEISPEALKDVYAFSKEKLAAFPKQKEYLLTYWLNYAATAIPSIETGKMLLADYKTTFPQSPYSEYISRLIRTKESLQPGASVPDVTLLAPDSSSIAVSSLSGKPVCMVFSFSIGQHEPALKVFEDKYADKAMFVYVLVAPGIPLRTWKKYVKERAGVKHLWASDAAMEVLKEKYAIDIRYPFLVINASGKIVNRWIPQEFPNNQTLDAELQKVAK
ncbi:TlpA family protein disulfide reductase [Dyadobacter sediminis]|uniref:Thioredoxin domain-containing protein n=1 Tax=Dyadobacter sediminis TaxID=1493691 RepID=A0A5R9KDF0_9BACT|nr:hypothetical protein [Dyadobacter sediminis]TLU94164.1 hypothetical protein FEM55_07855 [Dyadobacter sediminis]GGB93655.1 hypothetical protein GCM10011325_21350 [Dyadobacter sediminis]